MPLEMKVREGGFDEEGMMDYLDGMDGEKQV